MYSRLITALACVTLAACASNKTPPPADTTGMGAVRQPSDTMARPDTMMGRDTMRHDTMRTPPR